MGGKKNQMCIRRGGMYEIDERRALNLFHKIAIVGMSNADFPLSRVASVSLRKKKFEKWIFSPLFLSLSLLPRLNILQLLLYSVVVVG